MGRQGHEQHGNMRDRAVISGGGKADDRRILHGDRQQPRKTSFHRGSLIINRLEALGAVVNGVTDAWGEPKEIIAPFLVHEFGMTRGTEKIFALIGFVPMERTGVLKIDPSFRAHPTLPMHGEIGGTEDAILPEAERFVPPPAGIEGDDGLGFHLEGDVREDVLAVIVGVSGDGGNREGQGREFSKHGNGDSLFIPIVRVGDFIKGEFGFRVDDDMVSVAPVEHHLRLEGLGKMDFDAEPGIGIAAREFCLVEAVLDRSFEVVLPDIGLDGTGVQGENAAGDDFFLAEGPDESFPQVLQVRVGSRSKEAGEAFPGGRMLKRRESAGRLDGGVVFQFEGQFGQRRDAAETLIDQSTKKSFSGKRRASSGVAFLSQRRQLRKQFFETDPRRNLFGQKKVFHDTLDFHEGRRKKTFSRVSKDGGLGYVADSYEMRWIPRRRGAARKSVFLTRSKTDPKTGGNYAFLAAEAFAYN